MPRSCDSYTISTVSVVWVCARTRSGARVVFVVIDICISRELSCVVQSHVLARTERIPVVRDSNASGHEIDMAHGREGVMSPIVARIKSELLVL
ncbi:hypothetical protein Tco_0046840 [Tanacetum coccineum]